MQMYDDFEAFPLLLSELFGLVSYNDPYLEDHPSQ